VVCGLRADVFQVPHHGRPNPEGVRLATAVRPRVGLVSTGAGEERLLPYEDVGARLFSTHDGAMIEVDLDPGGIVYVRRAIKSFALPPRQDAAKER